MEQPNLYLQAQDALKNGQHAFARAILLHDIAIKPKFLAAHSDLMHSYLATQEFENAEKHARIACILAPNEPQLFWLYGQLQQVNQKPAEQVLRTFLQLEQMRPDWLGLHLMLAKIYFGNRQIDLAKSYFERALQSYAHDQLETLKIKWEYAMMLLTLGEYRRGWSYHETRLQLMGAIGLNVAPMPATMWQGQKLKDKTIVVHGEQELGDEIMYASMLKDLERKGAKVILACTPVLVEVMQKSFPKIKVIAHSRSVPEIEQWINGVTPPWWQALKKVDYHIPMGSLAYYLRPNRTSFPRQAYLVVDEERQTKLHELLEQQAAQQHITLKGKKLIALAWCDNLSNPLGQAKSIALQELLPLNQTVHDKNIVFVSLQNRQYGKQALSQNDLPIVDMSEYIDDFADTLALASLCQKVVTIDTSYLHICAAAGLDVVLLLRRNCDWRFGWTSADCVWYPNVHIIRQIVDRNWQNVVQILKNLL